MIEIKDLRYMYPGATRETLHGLDFKVNCQEIFGFLGPSGAGKSTTQNILIGLLKGYRGEIKVLEKELADWGASYFEEIGVSFEFPNHYLKLSALENLSFFCSLYEKECYSPRDVLKWVGLEAEAHKKVSEFSKGMKIRLNVARSLLHQPKILFLDEPTSGLDPVNARRIKELVLELRERGTTIFVTTHNMAVADELCDRVAFITNGKLRLVDAPSELKKRYGKRRVKVEYQKEGSGTTFEEFDLDGLGQNQSFFRRLNAGVRIETIHTLETTLENIFIEVTGEELMR